MPCQVIAPVLERLAAENHIELIEVDVTKDLGLATAYEVLSVPTVVFIDEVGNDLGRIIGTAQPSDYAQRIAALKEVL